MYWMKSIICIFLPLWADDTRTVLKLKMSYSLRHFFIMTKAQEYYKSARPESCNRSKISQGPLPSVSLFPCLRTMSLCPWKCVGCSWYGSTWLWKHWLSSWELQRHSELPWGDELCCQRAQVDGPGSEAMDPRAIQLSQKSVKFKCFGIDEWSNLFLLYFFLYILLFRNRNNSETSN